MLKKEHVLPMFVVSANFLLFVVPFLLKDSKRFVVSGIFEQTIGQGFLYLMKHSLKS